VRSITTIAAALAVVSPVSGHHSDAGIDMASLVTFDGTVIEFNWRNPHVYFTVETTNERGEPVEWALQMGSAIVLTRRGWTRESVSSGDRVTVRAHPARNGDPYGILESIDKEGGITLDTVFYTPEVTVSASTLSGKWMADTSKLVSYPGGFDGFFLAELTLTEMGRAAAAEYDPLSDENPEATCIGRPTPAMILSTGLYPLEIQINAGDQTVVIRSEFWDEERTVYMDGREHPDSGERFDTGHSIGRWEEETLVVDTRNFADHRSPYQIGVPSGALKHVEERYRLTEDGTRIVVEFTLEDPEYLAQPLKHSRELIYTPHLQMSRFDCDPETTRRFVPE